MLQRIIDAFKRRYNSFYSIPCAHKQFENINNVESEDITKEEETKDLPTYLGMEGYYGSLYIAGDMNEWKGKYYKMTYLGNGIYTITFEPRMYRKKLYLKIYDGYSWYINWSIQNNNLIMHDTDAFIVENVYYSSKVTIEINTILKTGNIRVS